MNINFKFIQELKKNLIIHNSNLYSDNIKRILFLLYTITQANEKILFIASSKKYCKLLKKINLLTFQPFFVGKWIGGYLTNFDKINKGGNIDKKKEEKKISCIILLDPENSLIAIQEAIMLNIPIICFLKEEDKKKFLCKYNYSTYISYFLINSLKKKMKTLLIIVNLLKIFILF